MKVNSVSNCTYIIRTQIEYNTAMQMTTVRCILETPTTGKRRGFTAVNELMDALRAELMDMQNQSISRSTSNKKET